MLDRFDTPRAMLPFALAAVASLIPLQLVHGELLTLAIFLLFGIGCGGLTSHTSYFTTRYFGVRAVLP
ncbi:hypothetical protein [Niveispirillum sp.]|uniref:hypothetical protein n=1 Tax=Niveispirillum sp. TaxID=1917217 RepID=UPI001B6E7FF2|nr:hypothetical protein [Niveispirillum sp.]MBP7336536.1 hypothetical protein [Niveispirillum sp.]